MRAVGEISRAGAGAIRCLATYIGAYGVLTSARCLRRLGGNITSLIVEFQIGFGTVSKHRAIARHDYNDPGCPAQQSCSDIALVVFSSRSDAGKTGVLARSLASTLRDPALRRQRAIAPAPIASFEYYLSDNVVDRPASTIVPADRYGRLDVIIRIPNLPGHHHLIANPIERVCADPRSRNCRVGTQVSFRGKPNPCASRQGQPVFVWLPPLFALIAITVVPGRDGCVASLATDRLVEWLRIERGIPVTVCDAPGRCSAPGGG